MNGIIHVDRQGRIIPSIDIELWEKPEQAEIDRKKLSEMYRDIFPLLRVSIRTANERSNEK